MRSISRSIIVELKGVVVEVQSTYKYIAKAGKFFSLSSEVLLAKSRMIRNNLNISRLFQVSCECNI